MLTNKPYPFNTVIHASALQGASAPHKGATAVLYNGDPSNPGTTRETVTIVDRHSEKGPEGYIRLIVKGGDGLVRALTRITNGGSFLEFLDLNLNGERLRPAKHNSRAKAKAKGTAPEFKIPADHVLIRVEDYNKLTATFSTAAELGPKYVRAQAENRAKDASIKALREQLVKEGYRPAA